MVDRVRRGKCGREVGHKKNREPTPPWHFYKTRTAQEVAGNETQIGSRVNQLAANEWPSLQGRRLSAARSHAETFCRTISSARERQNIINCFPSATDSLRARQRPTRLDPRRLKDPFDSCSPVMSRATSFPERSNRSESHHVGLGGSMKRANEKPSMKPKTACTCTTCKRFGAVASQVNDGRQSGLPFTGESFIMVSTPHEMGPSYE